MSNDEPREDMVNLRGDHADFPDRDRRSAEAAGDADAHRGGGGKTNKYQATILEIVLVTIFQLVLHGCHAKFCLRKHLSFLLKYKKNSLNIKQFW